MPTKKTTTKKATVTKKVAEQPVEIKVDKEPAIVKEKKTTVKIEPRKFQAGDMISCKCVRPNKVVFHSKKTDNRYYWYGYGDIVDVDYADLMSMRSAKMSFLFKPLIVILDQDLVDLWSKDLKPIYDAISDIDDMDELFDLPVSEFDSRLQTATPGLKEAIKATAARKVKDGSLDSLAKIKIIDEAFGTAFAEFI